MCSEMLYLSATESHRHVANGAIKWADGDDAHISRSLVAISKIHHNVGVLPLFYTTLNTMNKTVL